MLAIPEHPHDVHAALLFRDLGCHRLAVNLNLQRRVNHLRGLVRPYRPVHGVLAPADHVVKDIIHRRTGALQLELLGLDLKTTDKFLRACTFLKLLLAVVRNVIHVVP